MRNRRACVFSAGLGIVLALSVNSRFIRAAGPQAQPGGTAGIIESTGPDVIVSSLPGSIVSYAYENTLTGYITGLAIGTQSCNIGDQPLSWEYNTPRHPVIRSSMYRLKNNRFEQIGMSWVKHGFYAENNSDCGMNCTAPPGYDEGSLLFPGCSDPYLSYLNGDRSSLGPTLPINAFTGAFTMPVTHPAPTGQNARLQVHNVDLDPDLNTGARYYMGAQYIAADDASAGNAHNNASYQRANVVSAPAFSEDECTGNDPQRFCVFLTDFIHATESPIRAWKDFDPSVAETDAQVPGEGLFTLSAKVTDLGTGFWHYEYALQNLNSDRSGKSLTIPIAVDATINNVGFHDVDYHSGEPISNTDWQSSVLTGTISWTTQDYSVNPNANALRWGTIYNFRFDTNVPPGNATVVLDLFKPGAPDHININTLGPIIGPIDCNGNGVFDECDVSCGGVDWDCSEPCGTSGDCDSNGVPDECESDCNHNGIADPCDLVPQGASQDCNHNGVPDECEEDCNHNGIPDSCEGVLDCDSDGVTDCEDLCPCTTPPNGCFPPEFVCCYYQSNLSIPNYSYFACLGQGGTPLCQAENPGSCGLDPPACPTSFCRQGCMVGDADGDGDFDLADFSEFLQCFTGEPIEPPSSPCQMHFDYNDNNTIELSDFENFRKSLTGPLPP